jgi:glyoxylase-like metal-dependent hydrolase (beta-lactamase superfamily II)
LLIENPPVEIADRLWMLGSTAYPLYLVKGTHEGAIIEGGISALGPLLFRQMEALGIAVGFVRQLVITHAHPDHVMAVPLLRERFAGLKVLASPVAAATLAAEKAIAFFRQIDEALTASLRRSGAIPEADRPQPAEAAPIAVDRVIAEGDEVAVEDMVWTVLATPGHSDCSISLHNARDRVLVISDASGYYMPERGEWWPNYFSDYGAYVASLERLKALDAEVLCLSHNGAIRGAADVCAYFAGALAASRDYHQRILAEVAAGKAARQVAEELGAEIHGRTGVLPVEFFQKNCGILVKQSLRYAGVAPKP